MSNPTTKAVARWRRRRATTFVILLGAIVIGTCVWVATRHELDTAPTVPADATVTPAGTTPTPTPSAAPTSSPSASPASASDNSAAVTNDTTLVTIGDSIMAGHGLTDPATSAWPIRLATQTGTPIINDSCSGAGFVAAGDCGTDYAGLLSTAVAAHPGLIIIESSDNDFAADPTQLASATNQVVRTLHAALPNTRIVGLSTLWDQPGSIPTGVTQSSADLQRAVAAVGGTFINIGQPIDSEPGLLQADNEHPTDSGQQALSSAIAADLRHVGLGP